MKSPHKAEPGYLSRQVSRGRWFYFARSAGADKGGLDVAGGGWESVTKDYMISRETFPWLSLEFVAAGRGLLHMARSAAGDELSTYHLQSGIAACHCMAKDHAATDWSRILALYDLLLERDRSPVVALNRTVAVAEVHGAQAGLDALNKIPDLNTLEDYHLLHAVRGEFEARMNHHDAAAAHFRKAMQLAEGKPEQEFLARRLESCEQMSG